jgi:hypothetical protein
MVKTDLNVSLGRVGHVMPPTLRLDANSIVENDIQQRTVYCQATVALNESESSLRKSFMKKLTLERVVRMIPASVSCLIFGSTGSGLPSF